MKGAGLFVLLSSLWIGGFGLTNTTYTWTTSEDASSQENMASATIPLNKVLPIPQITSAEIATIPETRTSEDSLLKSTVPPSETGTPPEGVRNQTLTPTGKTEGVLKLQTLALPTKPSLKFSPREESVVFSNSTLKFLQSFARKSNQQAISPDSVAGGVGNRSPRETYLSRGDSSGSQKTNNQKSSFETTRGKNWCAYVHTRLSPTVILDNQVTYLPNGRGPCGSTGRSCPQRSQKIPNPVYRMQHKIVTSLEWKCCPGFSGAKCQLKAQEQQHLIHSNQAESHTAVGKETAKQEQQKDCGDPAVTQKMTEQMNHQAMKLTLLQKKIDNISLAVSDVRNTYSSLEGKINEDKGREFQSFLKGLKSKSISDLVKNIVREQFKVFQNEMQETVAQLFKTVSSLSEDLENTRQIIRQVNESVVSIAVQQKSVLMQENRPSLTDILDLKNHIVNIRQEMTFTCEKPIKELEAKQIHLEGALEQEHSRSVLYYESLNKTLSKMREVHEQLLSTEQVSDQKGVPAAESLSNNVTEYMSALHENMKKQGLMMLQMFDDLHIHDSKINNLTMALEMEKESVRSECEDMLSKCRNDFKFQIKDTEENLQVLNQTLAEVLFPMDNKVDKMNEQLNDLTYDMEILQPLLERGAPFRETTTYEQPKEAVATRKKVENLIIAVNTLNILIKELSKRHNLLRNEVQSRSDALDRRINEYALEMEDGLNKTMTIINNAIDFIQDNYMLKETLSTIKYDPEVHHKCTQNMETILTFIPQFQRLNDSIQMLVNDSQRYSFVLQVAKVLADSTKDEKLSQSNFQKIYQMFNETTSQVTKYRQNMSHLEEKILSATKISQNFETRLQGIESKVTKTLIPYYVSLKKGNTATNERDQGIQLQVLSSRFKALEAKSIHLSINFSLLNKTLHEVLMMCHDASTSISELNATIPKWIEGSLPDIQLLQKGLMDFVESVIEIKTRIAISNLTWYVNQTLSGSLANIVKSQKQIKLLPKKPNSLKKPTGNLTTVLIGRTQRNTDNVLVPETEGYSDCSRSPCQNGGTCINGRTSSICACRHPFTGGNCTVKLVDENALAPDFSKGSYRYAPMVAFFASHTYGMTTPGPILFNNLDVNYGASYTPRTGKFRIPYLGVYVFKYTIESFSAHISGFLVVDGRDKLAFESESINSEIRCDRVLTGDALLELNYGQEVWLRLVKGTIPAKFPPATTFSGYLLYRT
ncbi:multimerin-1 isoform X1 [Panthera uncia]|uniref:multimerin-1 isoform X1 n=1 Tax=Panthera uncia TaxID=29064 RepID=UPI0020FFB8DB|nr:multimerin-1 isoform X1 [Panthera uncia]XP_049488071.1 multimerin-1 isoform X1 [Panthera uncia]XP_049488073.1 multimerin-1 isoform X1 [Panthera uncia]XP_049488074.1 multimerin-1 isoform X1 [Panthera uncia]